MKLRDMILQEGEEEEEEQGFYHYET